MNYYYNKLTGEFLSSDWKSFTYNNVEFSVLIERGFSLSTDDQPVIKNGFRIKEWKGLFDNV